MTLPPAQPFMAGKYLITPLSRIARSGRYTASVSIRRGQGCGTNDRIYTFKPEFITRESALLHAVTQGRRWIHYPQAFA
ncbi:hypothetical protein [Comamonas humi]